MFEKNILMKILFGKKNGLNYSVLNKIDYINKLMNK